MTDPEDPLAARARELESKTQQTAKPADNRPAWVSKLDNALNMHGVLVRTYDLFGVVFKVLGYALGFILRILRWLFGLVIKVFNWAAYEREDGRIKHNADGKPVFSAPRLVKRSAAIVVGLWLAHIVLSATYFYLTKFEELVYTTGKQEITTGELYQFTGCTSLPCSTDMDNGKFYVIAQSWYFPYLMYPEENVYANIPQQDAACLVKGYGVYFRRLKFLHRRMQWYQKVYSVSCRPYTDEEKQIAVDSGIVKTPEQNSNTQTGE